MSVASHPDFVRGLCVALAHRWERGRLFMIMTSYFDESGTHGGSPVTIMAGVLGTARQWVAFQRALDGLKQRYGFQVFHATQFKHRSGEFSGWSPQKCISLINELADLTANGLTHGAVMTIKNADYDRDYRTRDTPAKLRLDTKYALAFRLCLVHLIGEIFRRQSHHKKFGLVRLHVVLESGHEHWRDAERAYHEEAKALQTAGCDLLAGVTVANKDRCDPLMVADFLAHTTFMRAESWEPPPPDADLRNVKEKASLMHLGFDPGGLATFKASLVDQWNARRVRVSSLGPRPSLPGGQPS